LPDFCRLSPHQAPHPHRSSSTWQPPPGPVRPGVPPRGAIGQNPPPPPAAACRRQSLAHFTQAQPSSTREPTCGHSELPCPHFLPLAVTHTPLRPNLPHVNPPVGTRSHDDGLPARRYRQKDERHCTTMSCRLSWAAPHQSSCHPCRSSCRLTTSPSLLGVRTASDSPPRFVL